MLIGPLLLNTHDVQPPLPNNTKFNFPHFVFLTSIVNNCFSFRKKKVGSKSELSLEIQSSALYLCGIDIPGHWKWKQTYFIPIQSMNILVMICQLKIKMLVLSSFSCFGFKLAKNSTLCLQCSLVHFYDNDDLSTFLTLFQNAWGRAGFFSIKDWRLKRVEKKSIAFLKNFVLILVLGLGILGSSLKLLL